MKKLVLATVILCLTATNSFPQSFYVKGFAGYAIQANKNAELMISSDILYTEDDEIQIDNSYQVFQYSSGSGWNFGGAIGYDIFPNLSFEAEFLYLKGKPNELNIYEKLDFSNGRFAKYQESVMVYGDVLSINPSFVLYLFDKKVSPYVRIGATWSKCSLRDESTILVTNNIPGYRPTERYYSTFEYESKGKWGVLSGIGIEFKIKNFLSILTEARYTSLQYTPKKGEFTRYDWYNENILDDMTASERYFEFVSHYSDEDNVDEDTPTKQAEKNYAFSNLNFQVGVKFYIPPKPPKSQLID